MNSREFLQGLTKQLANDGKLIEARWVGLRLACGLENAPAEQVREMRMAFMAGAQHTFHSILTVLDPGEDPTDDDLRRMDLINRELTAFYHEMLAKGLNTMGTA